MSGNGSLSEEDSGVLRDAAATFASRTGRPEGKTSPEELIASAHATYYAMALSNTLVEQDAPPVRLKVDAVCTLDDEQLKITTVDIEVRGEVSGLDDEEFRTSSAVRRRRPGASRDTRASPGLRRENSFMLNKVMHMPTAVISRAPPEVPPPARSRSTPRVKTLSSSDRVRPTHLLHSGLLPAASANARSFYDLAESVR
jgi:lipoyl-dependent peroxiredoxin